MSQQLFKFGFKRTIDNKDESASAQGEEKRSKREESKKKYEAKRTRQFQPQWKDTFPWLDYDQGKDVMFCKYCREFPNLSDQKAALVVGSNNFRIEPLKYHGGFPATAKMSAIRASDKHWKSEQAFQLKIKKDRQQCET